MSPSRALSGLLAVTLACATVTMVGAPASAEPVDPTPQTLTFSYTGATQSWTVPDDVVEATFDLYGAQGAGEGNGGLGGRVTATVPVTPGEVVTIIVGGAGGHPAFDGVPSGFNGGGDGWHSGGGGTDVRVGGTDLDDRVMVAGGGGASASFCSVDRGGDGGETGQGGSAPTSCTGTAGGGATPDAGGVNAVDATLNGSAGQGGGRPSSGTPGVSGGGGGWYGGAGALDAAAGGGSSHGPAGTVFETGVRTNHGLATVTFVPSAELVVSLEGAGTGTVTSAPAGIDCGTTCTATFAHGTQVTLTATPDASSTFTGWSGACTGTGECAVALDQARDVTVTYATVTPQGPTEDPAPMLSDVRVKPEKFVGGERAKATLRWRVSEDVELSVRLRQTCQGEVCGRYYAVPTTGKAGPGSYELRGDLKPAKLRPGRYRLTLVAIDSVGQRDRERVFFTVRG